MSCCIIELRPYCESIDIGMSDSDSSNSDSVELGDTEDSWIDDITACQNELEQIIIDTNDMLKRLEQIQNRIDGPSILFEGKKQSLSKWLTEWEVEAKHDTVHRITWGQFLIEKLAQCTDCA